MTVCDLVRQLEQRIERLTPRRKDFSFKEPIRTQKKILETGKGINGKINSPDLKNIPRIDLPSSKKTGGNPTSLVNRTVHLIIPPVNRSRKFELPEKHQLEKEIEYFQKQERRSFYPEPRPIPSRERQYVFLPGEEKEIVSEIIRTILKQKPTRESEISDIFGYSLEITPKPSRDGIIFDNQNPGILLQRFQLRQEFIEQFFNESGINIGYIRVAKVKEKDYSRYTSENHILFYEPQRSFVEGPKILVRDVAGNELSEYINEIFEEDRESRVVEKIPGKQFSGVIFYGQGYTSAKSLSSQFPGYPLTLDSREYSVVVRKFNLPISAADIVPEVYAYSRAVRNITCLNEELEWVSEKPPEFWQNPVYNYATRGWYSSEEYGYFWDIAYLTVKSAIYRVEFADGSVKLLQNTGPFQIGYGERIYEVIPPKVRRYVSEPGFEGWIEELDVEWIVPYSTFRLKTYIPPTLVWDYTENFGVIIPTGGEIEYIISETEYFLKQEDTTEIKDFLLELSEFWEEEDLVSEYPDIELHVRWEQRQQGTKIIFIPEFFWYIPGIDEDDLEDILSEFENWKENQTSFEKKTPIFEINPTRTKKEEKTEESEQEETQEERPREESWDDYATLVRKQLKTKQKIPQNINKHSIPKIVPKRLPGKPMTTPIPLPPIGGWQQIPGQLLTPPPRSTPASPITRLPTPNIPRNNIIPFPGTEQQTETPTRGGSTTRPPSGTDFPCEQFGACARRQLPPILRRSYQDDLRPALDAWFNARLEDIRNALNRVENNTLETLNRIGDPAMGVGGQRTLFGSLRFATLRIIWNNAMTAAGFIVDLHNAMMLSRNVIESLGMIIDNGLRFFNLKDENGEPLELTRILGDKITNLIKKIIGEENWNETVKIFKKLSAIYTAAAQVLHHLTNMLAGLAEACEIIAEMLGKVGNAIKGAALIFENSYNWFNETFTFKTGRLAVINKINSGLMDVQDTVDTLTEVSEEFLEAREEATMVGNSILELNRAIEEATRQKEENENTKKQNSQFQGEIRPQDLATP